MASVICDFCGSYIDSTQEQCPNCGAPNGQFQRTASDTPRTIEELKAWYASKNLPPEHVTRFFIGRDISDPKAFGIFRDESGNFVVYKNKADGSRAIRYNGKDEAYAVNEIYLKLKSEILQQKERQMSAPTRSMPAGNYNRSRSKAVSTEDRKSMLSNILAIVMATVACCAIFGAEDGLALMHIVLIIWMIVRRKKHKKIWMHGVALLIIFIAFGSVTDSSSSGSSYAPRNQYLKSADSIFYHTRNNWYYYDRDDDEWYPTDEPSNYNYYDWDDDNGYQSFEDSGYSWDIDKEFATSDYDDDDWDYGDDDYSWSWYDDDDDYDWGWSSSYDSDWGSSWDSDWGSSWDSDW